MPEDQKPSATRRFDPSASCGSHEVPGPGAGNSFQTTPANPPRPVPQSPFCARQSSALGGCLYSPPAGAAFAQASSPNLKQAVLLYYRCMRQSSVTMVLERLHPEWPSKNKISGPSPWRLAATLLRWIQGLDSTAAYSCVRNMTLLPNIVPARIVVEIGEGGTELVVGHINRIGRPLCLAQLRHAVHSVAHRVGWDLNPHPFTT